MTKRPQHGSIDVPEVGSIPALVELDVAHATAMLLVRPLRGLGDVVGTQVGIDMATSRGLLHVDARVAGVRNGEVLDLEVAGDRELIQRRDYARVDAILEVKVASAEPGGAARAAAAINISGSGALVSPIEGLERDDAVELSVQLAPYEPPIRITGRVVREADERLWAVHFEHMHQADRERIVRFVFERQRLEIQRVRRA